jgi:SAM-dependent methyltransferase
VRYNTQEEPSDDHRARPEDVLNPPIRFRPPGTSASRSRRSWCCRPDHRLRGGTRDNALFFAARNQHVTGIDFLDEPIQRARRKAQERGLSATFLIMNATALKNLPEQFESVMDSGLLHVFSDDDRSRYVDGLATVVKPGGKLFLMCFSDLEPGTQGPRRVSQQELRDAFAHGWQIESIQPSPFEVRSDLKELNFSPGGPKAWFAMIRRTGV